MSGSALILNDYFDLEVDKVNAPDRPLPSGAVSGSDVITLTGIATFIGLGTAYLIDVSALLVSLLFWFVGFLYNWRFKENGLLGNLMVAASVGITFVIGGIAVGDPWNKLAWFFGLTVFLIDLGEEIAGDAMDMEGDKLRGSKSLAIRMGKDVALRTSVSIFFLVVMMGYLPFIFGWLETRYLLMVSAAGMMIVFLAIKLMKSPNSEEGRRIMRWIYLSPLFGLLAFILGQFMN